jgi:hypothetical protein
MNIIVLFNMKKLIIALIFFCAFVEVYSSDFNQEPDRFVQFFVSSLENREKSIELNEFLKSKDGVKMSRVDATSKVVFVIFTADKNYSETDFANWLNEKGYSFSCFNSGTQGVDSFIQLKAENCANK